MLASANVIWGARCGESARRVLPGETRTRDHAHSVRRRRESAYDRKAPHGLPSSRLVSTTLQRRSRRGDDSEENLITLCSECHKAIHTTASLRTS